MLIDDENIRVQYDSTAESPIVAGDPLPLPFKFVEKEQVRALLSDGTELIINQDYIVGYPEEEEPDEDESIVMTDNMVVILNIDIPVGETITIYRETALDQTSEFPQEARFSSRKIEDALDKLTMQNQEQRESLARALKLPLNAPIDIGNLALPNPEPNRSVKWNGQGTALVNTEFDPDTALITTENYKNQALTAATGAAKSEAEAIKQATDAKNAAQSVNDNIQSALDKSDALLNMSRVLPMFTPIWSDHTLNDASFLRADTFSWHSGKIYEAGYDTLVAEYNREECVTETEAGVTYKRTPSGFKIASLDQHENVLNAFTSTGKSWFYVLDIAQQRFKLPRTKYSFTGIRDTVGRGVDAGLPTLTASSNGAHTHTANSAGGHKHDIGFDNYAGSRYGTKTLSGNYKQAGWGGAAVNAYSAYTSTDGAHTHTTTSNGAHTHTIPGTADTVQPPATQMYLYFFVGNYTRPQADIDIGELVEYINDIDFVGETEDALKAINTTTENNLTNINTTTTNGINNLTTTKNNCITEINNTGVSNRVLKTGDTMTGALSIHRTGTQIWIQTNEFEQGVAVDANKYCGIQFDDKNGNRFGKVEGHYITDGTVKFGINAHRKVNGTAYYAQVLAWVDEKGGVNCSFPMCTSKATTTSSASTSRVATIVQNYVNGTSWYRVWSDGWKEQGGYSQNVTTTITFLKAFADNNYTITAATISTSTNTAQWIGFSFSSKTNKSIKWGTSTGVTCYWYACGY